MTPAHIKPLKRGDCVNVYHDPMTCLDFEGEARLVRYEKVEDDDLGEYWSVNFGDGYGDLVRWVKTNNRRGV